MAKINEIEIGDVVRTRFRLLAGDVIDQLVSGRQEIQDRFIKARQDVSRNGQCWAGQALFTGKIAKDIAEKCLDRLVGLSATMPPAQHRLFWSSAGEAMASEINVFVQVHTEEMPLELKVRQNRGQSFVVMSVKQVLAQQTANTLARIALQIQSIQQEYRLQHKKSTDTDAHFMRLVLDEAKKCKSEKSNTPKPKVAALVVRDGQEIGRAYRGELKPGDHAEFTLLEGKLSGVNLAGATLYVTLEPCTSRNHPKVPCAFRVIERRIARVVIAALDPNRDILGQGILALQEAGIELALAPKAEMDLASELLRDFSRHHRQSHKRS
ncbi:hypothetical protein HMI49_03880 [Corallococcus exercitus]|uniref:CMP/dCMP-type deaminase domain-containing protein n=1 Tax=Corallococcus exercitus TaxID=2316736 RepID=A0A7Y4KFI8_9BACT|nr:deaminase [Corallococcus exercitus]NOK32340.1 hypothetical protein [Corallococcus exercitus]